MSMTTYEIINMFVEHGFDIIIRLVRKEKYGVKYMVEFRGFEDKSYAFEDTFRQIYYGYGNNLDEAVKECFKITPYFRED